MNYRKKVLVICKKNDKFILVQHHDYSEDGWNFPGGGIEEGENPEQTAIREVSEELNLTATLIGRSKKIYQYDFPEEFIKQHNPIHKGKPQTGQQQIIFLAEVKGDLKIQQEELKAFKWVTREQLQSHLIFPRQYEMTEEVLQELE